LRSNTVAKPQKAKLQNGITTTIKAKNLTSHHFNKLANTKPFNLKLSPKVVYTTFIIYICLVKNKILDKFNPRTCIVSKIQKSNRIINNIFRKHLKQLNLSNSQVSILFVLSKKKLLTQKELSDILYLEKSTVNRNIERLIKQDFLLQNQFKKIEITQHGVDMVKKIIPIWQKAMQEAEDKLGKDGLNSLNNLIQTLTN